jgi:hypothetical protein
MESTVVRQLWTPDSDAVLRGRIARWLARIEPPRLRERAFALRSGRDGREVEPEPPVQGLLCKRGAERSLGAATVPAEQLDASPDAEGVGRPRRPRRRSPGVGLCSGELACRQSAFRFYGRTVSDDADGSEHTDGERRADRGCS